MILTVKGADFSNSLVDFVYVNYNGNVYGDPILIKKGNELISNITMNDKYNYKSLTVKVGGVEITGYTVKDNGDGTVTLSVPANLITDNVLIDCEVSYEKQIELKLINNSYINKESGELFTDGAYGNWIATDYISVNANERYKVIGRTLSDTGGGSGAVVYGYDSEKNPYECILGSYDASAGYYFNIPENVKYIRLGNLKSKSDLCLFKVPEDLPTITWIEGQYVSRNPEGTITVKSGAWTTTDYIDVREYKKLYYTANIPAAGVPTVYCVYGYDSNKNPIMPILTPGDKFNVFEDYLIEIEDRSIAYIVACGHTTTMTPSIRFI